MGREGQAWESEKLSDEGVTISDRRQACCAGLAGR